MKGGKEDLNGTGVTIYNDSIIARNVSAELQAESMNIIADADLATPGVELSHQFSPKQTTLKCGSPRLRNPAIKSNAELVSNWSDVVEGIEL